MGAPGIGLAQAFAQFGGSPSRPGWPDCPAPAAPKSFVDRMQLSGQQHVKLAVARSVNRLVPPDGLVFEVRQQRGTRQNQDRDDDAKSDRAALELQRVVKHRVSWRIDGVFEPAQQKTPAANLNLR